MRILQVIQKRQLRGAEMFASQLSQHLVEQGHEVVIVTLFQGDETLPFGGIIKELKANKKKRFRDFDAYKRLSNIIKEFQPDLVLANASDSLKYTVLSKFFFRWKQPLVFRNASMISLYLKGKISLLVNRLLMKQVSLVISVSETTRKDFCKIFPFLARNTFVVPIGVELQDTLNDVTLADTNIYAHVGGFSFEKNHKGLIDIFSNVVKEQSDATLWLIGDGPLRKEIEAYSNGLGLQGKVVFWGNRKDVPTLLSKAKALLLTSVIEGLPAVILEAFYYKVPVIAYNVGAIPELIENKRTGFLIDLHDEQTFADTINSIPGNTQLPTITENAYQVVIHSFTNQKIARQLVSVFEENLN